MHNRILKDILPRFGVIFLPQTIPIAPPNVDIGKSENGESLLQTMVESRVSDMRRRDCLRYPFGSPGGKAIEEAFLGGLAKVLDEMV